MTLPAATLRKEGVRSLTLSRRAITVAVVAAAGVVLRVWVYRSSLGTPNSDEAVMGLMARHVLDGEFPTFFWGVSYSGSQEALLAVPGFLVAGGSWLALRLVPMALSPGAAGLVLGGGPRPDGGAAGCRGG